MQYESLETLTASTALSVPDGDTKDAHKDDDNVNNHDTETSDSESKRSGTTAQDKTTDPLTLRTLVQRTLHTFLDVYGITTPEASFSEQVFARIMKDSGPQVYPDVVPALSALNKQDPPCLHTPSRPRYPASFGSRPPLCAMLPPLRRIQHSRHPPPVPDAAPHAARTFRRTRPGHHERTGPTSNHWSGSPSRERIQSRVPDGLTETV